MRLRARRQLRRRTMLSGQFFVGTGYTNPVRFNVYKQKSGIFGFIGATKSLVSFRIQAKSQTLHRIHQSVWRFRFNSREAIGRYLLLQQRLAFANYATDIEKVVMSQIGNTNNFLRGYPISDSDAMTFNPITKRISAIKHIVDMGRMLLFTSSGEMSAGGNGAGIVTPSEVNIKTHSRYGASFVPPIVINGSALFVQARGSVLRNLFFDFGIDGYRGDDLTAFSKHLFRNKVIIATTYQQIPNSIVWIAFDDGSCVGITYVPEQQILACHRHDTTWWLR